MRNIPTGEVFWYAVGRFFEWANGSFQDFGYFVRLGELPEPLFNGAPGLETAHFTFAAEPFYPVALPVDEPADTFTAAIDPPGRFHLFYQSKPCATFRHVESFSRGQRIATFERVGSVVGGATPQLTSNLFSARLTWSSAFIFRERQWDLREMLGEGVTQMGAAGPSFTPTLTEARAARSFVGTAFRFHGSRHQQP